MQWKLCLPLYVVDGKVVWSLISMRLGCERKDLLLFHIQSESRVEMC